MIGAAGKAISGVMSRIRSFLPFSPAKRGPFSGHGWTPYSGKALVEGLAEGMDSAAPSAVASIRGVMRNINGQIGGAGTLMLSANGSNDNGSLADSIANALSNAGVGETYNQTFVYPAIAPTVLSTQQRLQKAAMAQW